MTEKNQKSAIPSKSGTPTKDTEKNVDFSLKNLIDLVKYPVITEKTYLALYGNRQYTFDVDKRLTKTQIKKLFESLFNVDVIAVNTHIPPRRKLRVGMAQGFRPSFKRAIITVKEGQSINYNFSLAQTAN
uniref:Large ribosomal subunit protein uL23c n=1 Tax=Chlorogonium capillatum TaxID=71743 RepID=A0A0S2ICS8_9CHLO|nr:ribosomal protein L23 [Chlorogonium capillatum]